MTLSILEGHFLLQTFLSAIFRICGASRGPSASTELLVVTRLLLQLDETAGNFDTFWMSHRHRLEQCLQLRQFEEQFKQVNTLPF